MKGRYPIQLKRITPLDHVWFAADQRSHV